jgi:hypothetical protein
MVLHRCYVNKWPKIYDILIDTFFTELFDLAVQLNIGDKSPPEYNAV